MVGLAAGGAQDAANFRENIAGGYLPQPTDVTFEGVVKDYFFDTSPR
jgi:Ca-activated chloride channel family protein